MSKGLIKTMINRKLEEKQEIEQLSLFDLPTESSNYRTTPKEAAYMYITGGNATFTLESTKIGKRYTYKVMHKKNDSCQDRYLVYRMHGSENDKDNSYHYIGLFYANTGNGQWNSTDDNKLPTDAKMLSAFIKILLTPDMEWPDSCHFYKSGKCACCGRKLTVPQSIEIGIGPECLDKLNRR